MVAVTEVRLLVQHGHTRALIRLERGRREVDGGPEHSEKAGRGQARRYIDGTRGVIELKPPSLAAQAEIERAILHNERRRERAAAGEPDKPQRIGVAAPVRGRNILRRAAGRRGSCIDVGIVPPGLGVRQRKLRRGLRPGLIGRIAGKSFGLRRGHLRHQPAQVHGTHRARRERKGQHEPQRGDQPERVNQPRADAAPRHAYQAERRDKHGGHGQSLKHRRHSPLFRAARAARLSPPS